MDGAQLIGGWSLWHSLLIQECNLIDTEVEPKANILTIPIKKCLAPAPKILHGDPREGGKNI